MGPMLSQVPALSRPGLLHALAEGGPGRPTVLAPNARLAQALRRDFDRAQAAGGATTWETADVLPFGAFVARLWEDSLYSPRGAGVPLLLTPVQEQAAWDEAVRSGPQAAADGFSAPAAASQAREAWGLAHAWRIDARRAGPPGEDVAAWLDWSARYERATRGHTDAARLPDVVAMGLDLGSPKPTVVALAGFDIVTPQMADFLAALAAAGTQLLRVEAPARDAKVARIERTQYKDEISAAAAWARARLEGGAARIGIVVPDLARSRSRVERILTETMGGARPFNVSLGAPLSSVPLVGDALRVLALAGRSMAFDQASRLVRSPFIGGAETEMDVRARLDARLRDRSGPEIRLEQVIAIAAGSQSARAERLLDRLATLAALRKASLGGTKNAAEWAKAFSEALKAVGFPGERTLDSAEHQALDRWHALLADFGSVERVTSKTGYAEACRRLARMADAAIFQPESPEVPIQVLGVLESAGQEFDHLWVMGLTDDAWPLPARPNPFLPIRLQRAAGIPQSDPATSLELDRRITTGWTNAAPEVVFSHSRADGERELAPSPLIAGIPPVAFETLGMPALPSLREAIRRGGRIDMIDDARAPAITSPEQRGGTGLFRDQAACPFRGFAHRRLGAKPLETPRIGLDPRDRGNLLHEMLAEVWRSLESRAGLEAKRDQLPQILDRSAKAAVARVKKKRGDALSGRFERMEHERLVRRAGEWLLAEAQRPDFTVELVEDERPLTFGGVTVKARLDRMDRLDKGLAIIDYKTGEAKVKSWIGDRPDEPQLPMYALAEKQVSAVAFGQVKVGAMAFKGLTVEKDLFPALALVEKDRYAKPYRNWDGLLAKWHEELEALGRGFAQGDARVDPKRGAETCGLCDQHTFCRIAEKGTFGVNKKEEADE